MKSFVTHRAVGNSNGNLSQAALLQTGSLFDLTFALTVMGMASALFLTLLSWLVPLGESVWRRPGPLPGSLDEISHDCAKALRSADPQ